MTPVLLFLDFDGVLHSAVCDHEDQLWRRVPLFEDWLRDRPNVRVVVSSAWRNCHPLDELRQFFSADLRERFIGVTPELTYAEIDQIDLASPEQPASYYRRHWEIQIWLQRHGQEHRHEQYAIVDDDGWLFLPRDPHCVFTNRSRGLTQDELDQLDRILGLRPGTTPAHQAPRG